MIAVVLGNGSALLLFLTSKPFTVKWHPGWDLIKIECTYTWDFCDWEVWAQRLHLKSTYSVETWCFSFQVSTSLNVINGQGQVGYRHLYKQQLFEDNKLLHWRVQLMISFFGNPKEDLLNLSILTNIVKLFSCQRFHTWTSKSPCDLVKTLTTIL